MPRPGLFLDRDGTIVDHLDLLTRADQLKLLPGAPEAIARAARAGFAVIVVTNQPVIAHGLADENTVRQIHAALSTMLSAHGARVDAYYFCPHHPAGAVKRYRISCNCRKPEPGMLTRAAKEHGVDLAASVMIGDRLTDVAAGKRAGCRSGLVTAGNPSAPAIESFDALSDERPDFVVDDLLAALRECGL
jgi:D-glycero-D-manno-heptose 1,7-bisphosphate phosphatase